MWQHQIIILFLSLFVYDFSFAITKEQQQICRAIQDCRDHYLNAGCEDLHLNPTLASFVTTCSVKDAQSFYWQGSPHKECGGAINQMVSDLYTSVTNLPSQALDNMKKEAKLNLLVKEICDQKLGFTIFEAQKMASQMLENEVTGRGPSLTHKNSPVKRWNRCRLKQSVEIRNIQLPNIPQWEAVVEAVSQVARGGRCLNAAGQSRFVCPALTEAVAGGGLFFFAKLGLRVGARLGLPTTANRLLEHLDNHAKKEKERLSIAHQEDLLIATKSPAVKEATRDVKTDRDQMASGIVDSDAGKQEHAWKVTFFEPSPASTKFIRILQGQDDSPEGRVMKAIFDDHFEGRPMLPPKHTPAQIRSIMKRKKAMTGFHHEIPGMESAFEDFRNGLIDEKQLRTRLAANLGHNGPHAGFWKKIAEMFVGGALRADNPLERDFYRDTMYAGQSNAKGVTIPQYRAPVSPEGFIHQGLDRLSQATRGGMKKIFYELGGDRLDKNPYLPLKDITGFDGKPAGLNNLAEMLTNNPRETLEQVQTATKYFDDPKILPTIKGEARAALKKLSQTIEKRIEAQNMFVQNNLRVFPDDGPPFQRIEMSYTNRAGVSVKEVVTDDTPANKALASMERFMKSEERLNGDPMRDLGKEIPRRRRNLSAGLAGTTAALVGGNTRAPNFCTGILSDQVHVIEAAE